MLLTQDGLYDLSHAQALKASGVTFVSSMLERVIEEQARGDASRAAAVRGAVVGVIGDDLANIKPGSPEAMRLKEVLIAQGVWSQYLEVGIGPDAEIFTKSQPMSAQAKRKTITRRARSVRSSVCSTQTLRSTTCATATCCCRSRSGRVFARRQKLHVENQP